MLLLLIFSSNVCQDMINQSVACYYNWLHDCILSGKHKASGVCLSVCQSVCLCLADQTLKPTHNGQHPTQPIYFVPFVREPITYLLCRIAVM